VTGVTQCDELRLSAPVTRLRNTSFEVNGTAADYIPLNDQLVKTVPIPDKAIIATLK
jgi:hypothetical protein